MTQPNVTTIPMMMPKDPHPAMRFTDPELTGMACARLKGANAIASIPTCAARLPLPKASRKDGL
jgi:hypothetical protein